MKRIPLSYSGIATFKQCPHKFLRTKILKDVKEDFTHPATVWGSDVHKALEDFLRDGTPLGERFRAYQQYADSLDAVEGDKYIEYKMAVDHEHKPTDFFDDSCKYRGIVDYLAVRGDTAFLIDHKTGKHINPTDQLALNAVLIFAHFPEVHTVKAAFYWLQKDTYTKYRYTREHMAELHSRLFTPIVAAITDAVTGKADHYWLKSPSGLCGWCPVTDCEYKK